MRESAPAMRAHDDEVGAFAQRSRNNLVRRRARPQLAACPGMLLMRARDRPVELAARERFNRAEHVDRRLRHSGVNVSGDLEAVVMTS